MVQNPVRLLKGYFDNFFTRVSCKIRPLGVQWNRRHTRLHNNYYYPPQRLGYAKCGCIHNDEATKRGWACYENEERTFTTTDDHITGLLQDTKSRSELYL